MKIKYFFLFIIFGSTYAQYKVEYNYYNISSNPDGVSETYKKTYLYTDGIKSKFIANKVINGKFELTYKITDEESLKYSEESNNNKPGDSLGGIIIKNFDKKTYNQRVIFNGVYNKITDEKLELDYELTNEFKVIEGLNCQKAKTNYLKRNFDVWFTNEILIPDGPFLFSGLPGLVLEVNSEDGTLGYNVTKIEKISYLEKLDFNFSYKQEITRIELMEKILKNSENRFKQRKSKNPDGNFSTKINNIELPYTEFKSN